MITRIFRVKIHKDYRTTFEKAYQEISIPLVKSQRGLVSVSVGEPISKESLEYVMITQWQDLDALKNFVGEQWNEPLIPNGMEDCVDECWVHHYESNAESGQ